MAVVGVISGTTFAWMFGALTWGVDFSRSEHPPYPVLSELGQPSFEIRTGVAFSPCCSHDSVASQK
jgi:hypothetical protein